MYERIRQNKGFTLLEVLIVIAIMGLVAGIIFPLLNINNKFTSTQLKESNQRNDVRVASTYLHDDIKYAKEVLVGEKQLEIKDHNNRTIKYYIKQSTNNEKSLVREIDSLNVFRSIEDVNFKLLNDKLVSVKFITGIENNKSIEFKITRLDFELAREPVEEPEDSFYEYMVKKMVFLFGSNLSVSGSTQVNSTSSNNGSIIIDNWDKADVIFSGNNEINMKSIYINKPDNQIKFTSSTKLGAKGFTEIINIKGAVFLNNGGSEINGNQVFIDGDTTFNQSGKIHGKEIYIRGNVLLANGSAEISGDRIFIDGDVRFEDTGTIRGKEICITGEVIHGKKKGTIYGEEIDIIEFPWPDQIDIILQPMPLLHPDNWYYDKGYVSGGNLRDGIKIFANNYSFDRNGENNTFRNVIIVSKGNITLNNWMHVTGLLFAPNGKVTFDGGSFEGVVIAKDGFEVKNGGSIITYRNISDYIKNAEDFPLR